MISWIGDEAYPPQSLLQEILDLYITHALQAAPPPLHFDDYRLSFNAPANWRLLMTVNGEAGTDFNHAYTYTPPPNNKNNHKKSTQQKRMVCLLRSFPSSPTHRKPGFPTGTSHSGEGWYGRASCHGGVWSMVPLAKTGNWLEIGQKNSCFLSADTLFMACEGALTAGTGPPLHKRSPK